MIDHGPDGRIVPCEHPHVQFPAHRRDFVTPREVSARAPHGLAPLRVDHIQCLYDSDLQRVLVARFRR
jgi:hypothetical protein